MLTAGRVDGIGQFTVGEPLLAATAAPKEVFGLQYSDAGLDYYSNGIVASDAMIESNPDLVRRFVKATLQGLRTAIADPKEAGQIMHKYHRGIEVDIATGGVTIERFAIVEDAGVLINPTIVEGQIHGGVAQGIANALYEAVIYDEGGNILTGSLADYLVPTASEIPDLEIHHLETITDASITGVKGVGEGGAIGAPPAVVNAVADALAPFGVDVTRLPLSPRAIVELLNRRTP